MAPELKRYRLTWEVELDAVDEYEASRIAAMVCRWINRQQGAVLATCDVEETK
jgi:hypothetical protein